MHGSPQSRRWGALIAGILLASAAAVPGYALGGESYVSFAAEAAAFPLVDRAAAAPLWVDAQDWPGVVRAAGDLQADVARVSGVRPALATSSAAPGRLAVIIGTVGHSALIDRLVGSRKLDVRALRGRWEAFLHEVVVNPLPGVERALVIAGSDKRGTIYGIYDLSAQIGVSPWYWWADVPIPHHPELAVAAARHVDPGPVVKYRGIFLNDEAPDLTNWVRAKFGDVAPSRHPPIPPGIANYGHQFYTRLFELMLRLRANYLWPAMWDNAFNEDDPENARLADEYGIVMGTSHQEPMLRAQKEWDRRYLKTLGTWNYATQARVLQDFWRAGIRRNRAFESLITIGLRGANDTPMAPGGPEANRALLEQIVQVQRRILSEEYHRPASQVPQVWCLYKEVQDFYEAGMRVPKDVTLLWCDDNWGDLRRLPTAAERRRPGGAGIYYHFDYHGGPRSYQWINANPLPKIWDQMTLAHQYGADRIWIVNVGHFKGYELPLEFFLDLAWNPNRWTGADLGAYTRDWAAQQFGPAHAGEIAAILAGYAKDNGRRKPELLAPTTYSLVDYREAETVVADFRALAARAEAVRRELPASAQDAFCELVQFPTQASALLNELYLAAGRNALYARQGRAATDDMAAEVRRRFQEFTDLMAYFNRGLAGGKWDHFMDQPVLGYTNWRDPPRNSLRAIPLVDLTVPVPAALGVAVEGSAAAWPGADDPAALPAFDAFNRQRRYIDVFNRGQTPYPFTATASEPWIVLSETGGTVAQDERLWVRVDWSRAPQGEARGSVTVTGAGGRVDVAVDAFNPGAVTRDTLQGFVEGDGVVSIEAAHYTGRTDAGGRRWTQIEDYGHTLSAMRATAPADAPAAKPGKDAPCLEYRMYLFQAGTVDVDGLFGSTLNTMPGRGLHYAVAFDDEPPQTVTLVPATYSAQNGNLDWERSVENNGRHSHTTHTLAQPGYHVLKVWMIDPGVVLEKLVVNAGGLRPSYLGPPESFRRPIAAAQ
jgi:Glycosyl hydrolase family 115/Gylcosyl hydrolase family 115 C-terminal domain